MIMKPDDSAASGPQWNPGCGHAKPDWRCSACVDHEIDLAVKAYSGKRATETGEPIAKTGLSQEMAIMAGLKDAYALMEDEPSAQELFDQAPDLDDDEGRVPAPAEPGETPRTDAEALRTAVRGRCLNVPIGFARAIERDLNAATARVSALEREAAGMRAELENLRAGE